MMAADDITDKIQSRYSQRPPVPRLPIQVNADSLSNHLRKLDNKEIAKPYGVGILGIYITTNETGADKIFAELASKPIVPQSVHIGFSGWHNLDIIANRKSTRGIICDFNPENAYFLQLTFNAIKESQTRKDFMKAMHIVFLLHDIDKLPLTPYWPREAIRVSVNPRVTETAYEELSSSEEEIRYHQSEAWSWLATEERYQYIKRLVHTDKIVLLTEDITNTNTFKKIHKILQENNLVVDSLYISNICSYMDTKDDVENCFETIHALSDNDTSIIDADIGAMDSDQRVINLKNLTDKEAEMNWWFGNGWKAKPAKETPSKETPAKETAPKEVPRKANIFQSMFSFFTAGKKSQNDIDSKVSAISLT